MVPLLMLCPDVISHKRVLRLLTDGRWQFASHRLTNLSPVSLPLILRTRQPPSTVPLPFWTSWYSNMQACLHDGRKSDEVA
mmetsp:Transcript_62106/g.103121  ORF Transcript_62106/g.103121 Transcript_62106/m.103121 type:complete len:81 (-) Transcript_62106:355-597(-)